MNRNTRVALSCAVLLAAAVSAFAFGSWEELSGGVVGSGILATENRTVPPFTAIEIEGSGNVVLSQGLFQSVSVESDRNILPVVTTRVVGNVLHLGFKQGTRVRNITKLEFRITVQQLTGLRISGSGDVRAVTPLRSNSLSMTIGGSGSIEAEVDAATLKADIGGSGSIEVKGRAERLEVEIDGSGGFEGRDLESAAATVKISGSGNAVVNATETIDIDISGSGSVRYGGGGKATIHTSGSGTVREL